MRIFCHVCLCHCFSPFIVIVFSIFTMIPMTFSNIFRLPLTHYVASFLPRGGGLGGQMPSGISDPKKECMSVYYWTVCIFYPSASTSPPLWGESSPRGRQVWLCRPAHLALWGARAHLGVPLHHPLPGSDTFSTEILRRRLEDQEAGKPWTPRMGSSFWGQLGEGEMG